jgi:hypothetical protein
VRIRTASLVMILVAALVLDPYTYGSAGGDRSLGAFYPWQMMATVLLIVLLSGAAIQKTRPRTLKLLLCELTAYLALNTAYISRDGLVTRATVGNYGYYLPGFLIVLGLLVRLFLISMLSLR